jgi:long-chain acyl-CoA synthetase
MMTKTMTYAETLRRGADRQPDAVCLICHDVARTWSEILDRSSRAAQGILEAGVQRQERVVFLAKNCIEFFEILYGASMAGAVTAGVNWRLAPREMLAVINNAENRLLFVGREFLPQLAEIRADFRYIRKVVVIGGGADPGDEEYEHWLARQPAKDPAVEVTDSDIAIQTYTSGTTGLPKGVMSSNAAVSATFPMARALNVSERSVALIATPVFHATGAGTAAMVLSAGGRCVVAREAVPELLLSLIEKHRVTVGILVPAILKAIMESPNLDRYDVSSLDTIGYAASPISPELLERCLDYFGCRFIQIYGLTETNSSTILMPEEHRAHLMSAGRPLPGVTVRVVDPVTGRDVAEGVTGEVWIKAPTNMSGYWRVPEESAAVMTEDGFIKTGDAAAFREGYLYLQDRIKDMIVSGGENVYPIEIENVLIYHPLINDVAVIGVPSDKWGETIMAIVVREPDGGEALTEHDVIAYARENLARYKCPTSVQFVDALPRNPSGKVLKRVLREPFWQGRSRRIG